MISSGLNSGASTGPTSDRLAPLDALRGIAATTVLLGHLLLISRGFSYDFGGQRIEDAPYWWLVFTPLRGLWAGHEAVLFFFVLSGLVLTLQLGDKSLGYVRFIVRRVFRIYPLYVVAVIAAIVAHVALHPEVVPGASGWFNAYVVRAVAPTVKLVVNHLLLVGSFDTSAYNTPIWSLVHEMRISLVFPLLVAFLPLRGVGRGLITVAFAWALCIFAYLAINRVQTTLIADTLLYVPHFLVGAYLAMNRVRLLAGMAVLPKAMKVGLVLAGVLSYTWLAYLPQVGGLHSRFIAESVPVFGIAIFILLALSSGVVSRWLLAKPFQFLGRASYGVYLLQFPVIMTVVWLGHAFFPLPVLACFCLVLTIGLGWLGHDFVEIPFIRLGRRLAPKRPLIARQSVVEPAAPTG
jgi:peptidoglycan/LPS O-acetylase OafA/YrhL